MLDWPRLPAAAALLVAVTPGILAALWGREIASRAEEPGVPERMLRYRARLSRALAAVVAVLAVAAFAHAVWAVPLALLAARAGAFGVRKRVFGDAWSFGAYMLFGVRLWVFAAGFWVLLATGPCLVAAFPASPR